MQNSPRPPSKFWQKMIPRLANPKGLAVDRVLMRYFNYSFMGRMFTRAAGFEDRPHLILRTIHWKTGELKEVVLPYSQDGDNYLVVGSHGGRPKDAVWSLNIRANSSSWICVNRRWQSCDASILQDEARAKAFAIVNTDGGYSNYTRMTKKIRQLPVVLLNPNPVKQRPSEDPPALA